MGGDKKKKTEKLKFEVVKKKKIIEDWRGENTRLERELKSKEKLASDQPMREKELNRQIDINKKKYEMEKERFESLSIELDNVRKEYSVLFEQHRLLKVQNTQTDERASKTEHDLRKAQEYSKSDRIILSQLHEAIQTREELIKELQD